MSDIKWDIVCGEDHGVHFRNTWLIWIKYLYSCIDIEKIEKITVFFPVSTWTHLAFLKPQHSPEMCSTNFLPAAWRMTRTTFFFSLCTWPLTSHIWSLSNLILPKKGKSQPLFRRLLWFRTPLPILLPATFLFPRLKYTARSLPNMEAVCTADHPRYYSLDIFSVNITLWKKVLSNHDLYRSI